MNDNKRLSDTVRFQIIAAEATFVSAATAWEIATKFRLGKLPEAAAFAHELPARIEAVGFNELAVTVAHGQLAGELHGAPADPFDRMLIAQARLEGLTLISNEALFDMHGIDRLW